MELRDLFESLSRIEGHTFAASGLVVLSNLAIIGASGWALYRTGERAFVWLLLAALVGNLMILADFLIAPQVVQWAKGSAESWKVFRFVVYAGLAFLRAWGVWLLARLVVKLLRDQRAALTGEAGR